MLRILCTAAVVVAAIAIDHHPAQANEAPWCAVRNVAEDAVFWDCQYRSFEDCYAHLFEGNRGFCNQNPAYKDEPRRQPAPRHRVPRD